MYTYLVCLSLDQGTIVVSLRAKPAHTSRLLQSQAARSVREPTIFISHTPRAARVCAVTPHSAPKHAPHRFAGLSASRARLAAPFKSRTARASRRVRTARPRYTLRRSCPTNSQPRRGHGRAARARSPPGRGAPSSAWPPRPAARRRRRAPGRAAVGRGRGPGACPARGRRRRPRIRNKFSPAAKSRSALTPPPRAGPLPRHV